MHETWATAGFSVSPEKIEDGIRRVLPSYGIDEGAPLSRFRVSENATYLVGDPSLPSARVIRVQQWGVHSREEIQSELQWIRALAGSGAASTPGVIPTLHGTDVVDIGEDQGSPMLAAMFEFLDGREPGEDELSDWFGYLGQQSARMHEQSRSWSPPPSFTRPRWDEDGLVGDAPVLGSWKTGFSVGQAEREVLQRVASRVIDRLRRFGHGPDRFGLIHADLRLANLLVEGDKVNVIDFDDCGFGWYLYDLASALSFIEDRADAEELVDLWASGYRSVRPLDPDAEAEIPTFVMARRLWLVGWCGLRSSSEVVQAEGPGYTEATCAAAERYLGSVAG